MSAPQDPPTGPAQERSDGLAPGKWSGSLPETQKQNKKRDDKKISGDPLADLPEKLEEFKENLKETELHASAQQAAFPQCWDLWVMASGNRWRIVG